MEVGRAFTYVFEDENWLKKVLLGALFSLIPIINLVTFGYFVDVIRNVANGNPNPLPEWDDFGGKFVRGLLLAIVWFIYALPGILLYMCAIIPMIIAPGSAGTTGGTNDTASTIASLITLAGFCLFGIYMLIFFIVIPAVTIRFAVTGSFGASFQFGQIFGFITANLGNYIIALLLTIVASFIGQLGVIACFIGVFVTMFYSYLVMGHLYGQVYRQAVGGAGGIQTV